MFKFSKNDHQEEAICPTCGEWKTTDFTPQELQERDWECADCEDKKFNGQTPTQHGDKPITKYDPEFEFLSRLITLVVKQGVSVQEIKALSDAYRPLTTVDQAGDLAAQIWTLATTKYGIPREWLIKRLPESKRTASKNVKKADAYNNPQVQSPTEEQSEDFSDRPTNSYAYEPEKVSSTPEQDQKTLMGVAWDLVVERFFVNHARWSDVIKELKDMYPALQDVDIKQLRDQVKHSLDVQTNNIQSKKKHGLTFEDVLKALERQDPKPVRIDYAEHVIEFTDGSKLSFEDATKKALEIPKEGDAGNPDAGTGFYDTPGGADLGKRPEGDFPSSSWMPSGAADMDAEYWDNIDSALSKKEIHITAKAKNAVPRSNATHQVKLFDGRGVQYFANEKDANEFYDFALKQKPSLDPSKVQTVSPKEASLQKKAATDFVAQVDVDSTYLDKLFGEEVSFEQPVNIRWSLELEMREWGVKGASVYVPDQEVEIVYQTDTISDANPDGGYEDRSRKVVLQNVKIEGTDHASWDSILTPRTLSFDGQSWVVDFGNYLQSSLNKKDITKKAHCGPCAVIKAEVIKMLADLKYKNESVKAEDLEELAKLSADPSNNSFTQYLSKVIERLPAEHDKEIQKLKNHQLAIEDIQKRIDDGDMVADQPLPKKDSMLKKANPSTRYWIAPDGAEFNAGGNHGAWITHNVEVLKKYGIDSKKYQSIGDIWEDMLNKGWVRISDEPKGTGFVINVKDLRNIPSFVDDFIAKNFTKGDTIQVGGLGTWIPITDPFPSIQKAVNKQLMGTRRSSLKHADLNGKTVNEILLKIENSGGATYNLSKGDLSGTDNFAVSIYPDREKIEEIATFDDLENYINDNMDLLGNSSNSFGAWAHDGKVYFDVIATVSDQKEALELGRKHNQLAIFDLKNGVEIPTGVKRQAVEKKADASPLTQADQDQIAAASSPVYNIAINNFYEAAKRGHSKDRALAYAVDSVKNLEQIDPKKLTELINTYLTGLI